MSSLGKILLLKTSGVEVILKFLAHHMKLLTFQPQGQRKGFTYYKEDGREVEFKFKLNKMR